MKRLLGFDGVLRGLGNLLQIATDLADRADEGSAVYGVSVRVGVPTNPGARRVAPRRGPATRVVDDAREASADVFDEGDHYLIVVELPGVDGESVHWALEGRVLVIGAASTDRRYSKAVELLDDVDPDSAKSSFRNGILELSLWKSTRA